MLTDVVRAVCAVGAPLHAATARGVTSPVQAGAWCEGVYWVALLLLAPHQPYHTHTHHTHTRTTQQQVHLALCMELVEMIQNDLNYMLPDDNGQRVCAMALSEPSRSAVQLADEAER